jgi:pyruvate dehydrogenase E1 component
VIIQHGLKRMVEDQENVYYYLTVMNENYAQPGLTKGTEEGIIKGMYMCRQSTEANDKRVQLMGSGTILRESLAAAELLEQDWKISADVWSVTSFTELRREGLDTDRDNMLHPEQPRKKSYVEQEMEKHGGPVIASTDYMKLFADQIRQFMPKGREYRVLGTDGFGRSDFRYKLREHFEVNRYFVTVAALKALADEGSIPASTVTEAIKKYGINPNKVNPAYA